VSRKPLWAGWKEEEPQDDFADVIVRVFEEEDEPVEAPPPPAAPPQPRSPWLALPVTLAVVGLALLLAPSGSWQIADVPSGWGDVPMTCDTLRIEKGDQAAEFFSCRALGGRPLPPGLYESPESQWTSDITRRDARESRIRIPRDGRLSGWAVYSSR
jgi:hypothetical protein